MVKRWKLIHETGCMNLSFSCQKSACVHNINVDHHHEEDNCKQKMQRKNIALDLKSFNELIHITNIDVLKFTKNNKAQTPYHK